MAIITLNTAPKTLRLHQLLNQKRFRKMKEAELTEVIGSFLVYRDYEKLPGAFSWNKAAILFRKFRRPITGNKSNAAQRGKQAAKRK